jgi:hypothetical protein
VGGHRRLHLHQRQHRRRQAVRAAAGRVDRLRQLRAQQRQPGLQPRRAVGEPAQALAQRLRAGLPRPQAGFQRLVAALELAGAVGEALQPGVLGQPGRQRRHGGAGAQRGLGQRGHALVQPLRALQQPGAGVAGLGQAAAELARAVLQLPRPLGQRAAEQRQLLGAGLQPRDALQQPARALGQLLQAAAQRALPVDELAALRGAVPVWRMPVLSCCEPTRSS